MNREKILDKVVEITAFQLNSDKERIEEGQTFINDLGCDSLDCIEMLFEFEDNFDLNISDETAEGLKTIKQAVDYIEENSKREDYKCQEE